MDLYKGPQTVYKYRDWNNEFHRDILRHNEIYLASPIDFNDPFDCRITHNFSLFSNDDVENYIRDAGISLFMEDPKNPP